MAFPLVDGGIGETTDVHAGMVVKRVRVAIATNVTKATALENGDTVDGVVLATDDRVALLGQTSGAENGIWVVAASGAPTRSLDFDEAAEVQPGTVISVSEGTANKDSLWLLTTNAPITVDTTALVFFPIHLQGTGTPEAAVTAPIGAIYRRTDGGTSSSVYLKESGTGNTGWVAIGAAATAIVVVKSADESVTSSTTVQDDDELVFAVEANKNYVFRLALGVDGSASGDVKFTFSAPAGATGVFNVAGPNDAGSAGTSVVTGYWAWAAFGSELALNARNAGEPIGMSIFGSVRVGGTAGTVKLRWAQGTSSGTATKVLAGSSLVAQKG